MPVSWLVLLLIGLSVIGYILGRQRALASAGGDSRALHSLPNFYGMNVAMSALVPAAAILGVWLLAQPSLINTTVSGSIPASAITEGSSLDLVMSDVKRVAEGLDFAVSSGAMSAADARTLDAGQTDVRATLADIGVALGSDVRPEVLQAAQDYRAMASTGTMAMTIVVLLAALVGFAISYSKTNLHYRARNVVERGVLALLIGAASLAILTTVGIVFSMLFETVNFFGLHDWKDFFFGTVWAPNFRGDSELAILPLLWGTLYISVVALLVAVPIGLFAAIYLSEYASKGVRGFAKPLLEILAGIPTIVYGLFALVTFGPFLLSMFGEGGTFGVNWMTDARSVATAGIVMGIMLIPFVSSLSDDIINAVPQAMRDGSYGLGATKSETIRQVVLPAALPGIVGAILLAASRAIGETMIVVLGAGAIARLAVNPLEALTTITTRIVSQLTGDGDFASPETLVAFALGLTLFVLTLGLNVLALYIVRKYREQYE
ncbi:phosphate ABC transporter permease subunit PstC [Thalassovita mediterranea]|uniref:Phosphate transport system permease protein n=1 Tax=Thalassovita mediterranea TaxID=340021 RepID=A0A0P1H379_9RHOB|nr:phosphate ABC transporter permease subunit PstC [Thalassovita mediterranea]CUH83183.1 Phosphate transport system permease protein PstC [Thalassovita mediterranea]SIS33433.1 phosphate ABC transporter membrane protein 1, PhoT family [Thalassovita mediterranea]